MKFDFIINTCIFFYFKYVYTGSLLNMECEHCEKVTLIPTGTRHGPNVWDVNSKLGAGKLIFYKTYLTFYV